MANSVNCNCISSHVSDWNDVLRGGSGGNRGNRDKNRSLLEAIILSNMGLGSYSRGSSSGDFGGGGASGGW